MQPSEVCPVTEPPSDPVECPPENTKTEMPVDIMMSLLRAVFDHEPSRLSVIFSAQQLHAGE